MSAALETPTSVESPLLTRLDAVIAETIAPAAAEIDRTGAFPRAGIGALAAAGILGAASSPEIGGGGADLATQAAIVERLAAACSSTAMVVLMHFSATAILEAHGPRDVRAAIAGGEHLTTLAFSERGSRSHFWAPVSTAVADGDQVRLDAHKSWVTAAAEADSYVWSSRPLAADGPMTLWLVPAGTPGLSDPGEFDGLGLRGNGSRPITATDARIPISAMIGSDGAGLDLALSIVLPTFLVGNAAFSIGLSQSLVDQAGAHLAAAKLEHLNSSLAEQAPTRLAFARLLIRAAEARAFLADTLAALGSGRADATLRVLQVKAVAAEAASEVADGVLRICGGAAFRKDVAVERQFRDALAARVMAPTTDALLDFVGRAALGQPLIGPVA